MDTLSLILIIISGVAWTIAYVNLVKVGLKDKTYGMPFIALALNIAWEVVYTSLGLETSPDKVQTWIYVICSILDLGILYTYFKYGRKEFKKYFDKKYFIPWSILILIMAFTVQLGFLTEFKMIAYENFKYVDSYLDPYPGAGLSAFMQNLIMSVLFINMLLKRKNTRGQSMTIAISKWIGTLAPTILVGIILESTLILILGIFCTVFDLLYIWLLNRFQKRTGN